MLFCLSLKYTKMAQGLLARIKTFRNVEQKQIGDAEAPLLGMFDNPLPCFGCGIGWFLFLIGFIFPLAWYLATILYFANYYQRDPRERSGLAACAIAAMIFTLAAVIALAAILL